MINLLVILQCITIVLLLIKSKIKAKDTTLYSYEKPEALEKRRSFQKMLKECRESLNQLDA